MDKHYAAALLAVAAPFAAPIASGQSSATLYGLADIGGRAFNHANANGTP
ncbi:exported hypothetical protein [Cupriavidus necator]|uniref:Porin n=1 Tax=Cupriavidus necator TaxID=106590 RepID=A0A1K0IIQ3_CUPNE|nr:exported hypothetical protein [Cupriavidus necator]